MNLFALGLECVYDEKLERSWGCLVTAVTVFPETWDVPTWRAEGAEVPCLNPNAPCPLDTPGNIWCWVLAKGISVFQAVTFFRDSCNSHLVLTFHFSLINIKRCMDFASWTVGFQTKLSRQSFVRLSGGSAHSPQWWHSVQGVAFNLLWFWTKFIWGLESLFKKIPQSKHQN